ncbi:MAG: rod shape-determining protein MreD [bacterium]
MKAFLVYFLLFAFLSIFQASFLAFLFPTAVPSPFIPFLISLILYTENLPLAFTLAVLAGFFLDLFSSSLFGLYMLVYLVCILLVSTWRRTFFQKGFLTWLLLIVIFGLFSQLFYTLFLVIGGYPLTWEVFFPHLSWHLLYTVLLAFILFYPSVWMLKLVSQRRLAV